MTVGILFDLDGTLVDTADDLAAAMNFALSEMNLSTVDPGAVRSLVGFGAKRMLRRGVELAGGDPDNHGAIEKGLADFLEFYENNIAVASRPFPGAIQMIEDFRARGIHVAICTNKREALARQLLKALGIDELFGAIVGADTAAAPKPDPAPVKMAMALIEAETGIFIGDSDTDVKAAQNALMPCLVATFGYGPITDEPASGLQFGSYPDCKLIINSMIDG